jgi:hypothetical protein
MERVKLKRKIVAKRKWGGPQPGSGRPKGVPNRVNKERAELAAKSGLLPHEIALEFARAKVGSKVRGRVITWDDVKWAIRLAAPFYAPTFSQIDVSSKFQFEGTMKHEFTTKEEIQAELQRRGLPTQVFH